MMMRSRASRVTLVGLLVVVGVGLGAWAQSVSLTVTAYSDAVRFSAQGAVKELRVEILALSGQKVFDSGPVLGNALDWKLLNSQGQPVANGVYLYTVTVKDPSGNVTKKLGKLAVLRGKGMAAPPLTLPTVGQVARTQPSWTNCSPPCNEVHLGSVTIATAGGVNWATFDSGTQRFGVGTLSPTNRIHVVDTATPAAFTRVAAGSGDNRNAFLLERDNTGAMANDAVAFTFRLRRGDGTYINVAGARGVLEDPSGNGAGAFAFSTKGVGDVFEVERMRLTSTGNLGIGTIPSAKTHISNTANQPALRIDSSDGTNALEIYNTGSGSATGLIFRVERATGNVYADGSFTGGGADVAERIDVSEAVEPGDVVEIDPENPGKFRKAREAISTRVAGVISTAPGVVLGNKSAESNDARPILALAGRVPVKVTAKYGAIAVGDLLVSSPIPGYAMKCPEKSQCIGAVIGKALEPLAEGSGLIEVQIVLR
jgi:hypothetical protein